MVTAVKQTVRVKKLGPEDHGQPLSYDEFRAAHFRQGYHFELIDGRIYVSAEPNFGEYLIEKWLYLKLEHYSARLEDVINYVANRARVFVPGPDTTVPEPDVAAYIVPLTRAYTEEFDWDDMSPLLVAEVLTADNPHKDMVRNVALYRRVPSIKEYWIVDARHGRVRPTMVVYRKSRRGQWRSPINVAAGEPYTTPLLPGFKLILDPRR